MVVKKSVIQKKELKEHFELEELRHKNRMEEIEKETAGKKTVEVMKFDNQMQLQRIKSAEIEKAQLRRERNYGGNAH